MRIVRLKKEQGFSLVELMVVVAIIGILATIAIPKLNRFIAKARQSEAQTNLTSIYTFNKNFFIEFQGYSNSFAALGFAPEGKLRYNSGWSQAVAGPASYLALKNLAAFTGNASTKVQCPTMVAGSNDPCNTVTGADNAVPPDIANSAIAAPFDTFTAASTAVILNADTDIWTINENKNLTNVSDGTDGL